MKLNNKQAGFTLVELMVVVAIIGLLSAVAIPNFKKYQAKAKISEAKLQLAALYTAQSSFFSSYNMYGQCLRYIGYDPSKEIGNRYYGIGLNAGVTARNTSAHSAALNSGMQGTDCVATNAVLLDDTTNNTSWYPAGKGVGGKIITTIADATANAAGVANGTCTEAGIGGTGATTLGTCIGSQVDSANMVFQMSAVGYISGDNVSSGAVASGLTINHNKIIKSVVNGY